MFEVAYRDGLAKVGVLRLKHAEVPTPVFMPVATKAALKTLSVEELHLLGYRLILSNTYHLVYKPGLDVLQKFDGLRRFMRWDRALLTDSGGFQVFSLGTHRRITEEGVYFRYPGEGQERLFTPEFVVEAQKIIGSDIMMPLDVCLGYPASRSDAHRALSTTLSWLDRSLSVDRPDWQRLFGIIQGAFFEDLRRDATREVVRRDVDGYAIGGLAVGEPKDVMYSLTRVVVEELMKADVDGPVYLMGVGHPVDIVESVARGVDMFDCVLPMRVARNGLIYTFSGPLKIKNAAYFGDTSPIDKRIEEEYPFLRGYTRGYLHHLFATREMLGYRIATLYNLAFMALLMRDIRRAIAAGAYEDFRRDFLKRWA